MQGQESPKKAAQLNSPQLKKRTSVILTPDDFEIKHRLGRGAYGDVFLTEKISDKKQYAMKQILKRKLQKQKKQYQALIEKQLLSALKHPAVVKLRYAFQDKKILYFIMQLCQGGQFLEFIKLNINQLNEEIKRFYIAQIVNILEYLHSNGIIHRDIKPQNLMLSKNGHIKIIDFGTAEISNCKIISDKFKQKIQSMKQKNSQEQQRQTQQQLLQQQAESPKKKQRRSTFVGTCYYISPQLIEDNYCPPQADLWALGCILYLLYYCETPFKDNYQFAVFQKIKKCQLQFPKNNTQVSQQAIDLIKKLLKKNPDQRLGSGKTQELTYKSLKEHPYFKGIDIDNIFLLQPPKISEVKQIGIINKQSKEGLKEDIKLQKALQRQFSQKLNFELKKIHSQNQ